MIVLKVDHEITKKADTIANDKYGQPVVYVGVGAYSGEIKICAHIMQEERVNQIFIGRYTSIAGNIKIYCDYDRDYRAVYMGAIPEFFDYNAADIRKRYGQNTRSMIRKGMTVIGNDVWIGDDVTIISDVVIGNGAVVAAGSVVTRDIPPYTIWAGNPARQIKERFSRELAKKLMKISWWEFDQNLFTEIESDMMGEVVDFADKYYPDALSRYENMLKTSGGNKRDGNTMIAFVDMESDFPTFCDVVENFYGKYRGTDRKLVLFYHSEDEKEKNAAESVRDIVDELSAEANIELRDISFSDDELVISSADYFVLGRDIRNIMRISYAMKYDVKIISGVDIPMFRNV